MRSHRNQRRVGARGLLALFPTTRQEVAFVYPLLDYTTIASLSSPWHALPVGHPSLVVAACLAPGELSLTRVQLLSYRVTDPLDSPGRSYSPPRSTVVRVGRLTKNVTAAHLDEIFGCYGKIVDVDLPIDRRCESTFFLL